MTELMVGYGKALYSLSEDMNCEDKLLYEIREVSKALSENKEFIKLLNSPALSLSERHEILDDVFCGFEEILCNFLKLLTEERRMHIFEKCAKYFEDEYNLQHDIEKVTVESAFELKDAQLSLIKERLEQLTGKNVVINSIVSPHLLGGIIVRTKDRQFDATIIRKLKDIQSEIYKAIV